MATSECHGRASGKLNPKRLTTESLLINPRGETTVVPKVVPSWLVSGTNLGVIRVRVDLTPDKFLSLSSLKVRTSRRSLFHSADFLITSSQLRLISSIESRTGGGNGAEVTIGGTSVV